MRRIRLVLAYDGTNYSGWQYQKNAVTIEEVLNCALSRLLGEEIAVIGASRTDAGVHALQNVAVFDTENRMAADKICLALNQWLPEDIRALSSEEVAADWHPRKQNCTKTYVYRILNCRIALPTERLYSYFCYFPLDVEKMRQAAAYLIGEHDFRSFCTRRGQEEESVRTIYSLDIGKSGDMITIRVSGSGFLYNMVRIIAGTLIKVGTGVYPPEHMEEILDARDRRAAGPTAPAKGLTLVSMEYEQELRERIVGENKDWSYELIQKEIAAKGRACLIIRRCADRDLDRLLLRVTHQAMRNGAREVYVRDVQSDEAWAAGGTGGEVPRGRIREGCAYGHYIFHHAHDVIRMVKPLAAGGPRGAEPPEQVCPDAGLPERVHPDAGAPERGGSDAGLPERVCPDTEAPERGGSDAAALARRPRLCAEPAAKEELAAYCALVNRIFLQVPNSATLTEAEAENWLGDGGREMLFLRCAGAAPADPAGFLLLIWHEDSLEIGGLGIAEAYRGKGLARAALAWAEDRAGKRGRKEMELSVATSNEAALRLYETSGFRREDLLSRWYRWQWE